MKKISKVLVLFLALSTFAVAKSQAQIYVKARIGRPAGYDHRPFRPSRRHVWVSEEYKPEGSTYVYEHGYWAVPPRTTARWVPGYWRHVHNGGYYWVHGYWSND